MSEYHNPVLLSESIAALVQDVNGIYADATFGGGGHSRGILSELSPKGRLIAFDRDSDALANSIDDNRIRLIRSDFRFIHNHCLALGCELDGVLADLGVSSHQFDTAERGFSFRFDGPLDMRMNDKAEKNAATVINGCEQEELERIFRLYGEVDNARKVAQLICKARSVMEINTTTALNEALKSILPPYAEHKYLAKIYQALRIEVNDEMRSLEKFLYGATASLKKGGRLVVITYHSLEDRMVKNFIRSGNIEGTVEKDVFGNCSTPLVAVNRKPILPQENEIESNTRARSAKLRIAEKI